MFHFPRPPVLHDIEASYKRSTVMRDMSSLRKSVDIVVIDDKPFSAENNLKNSGFKITVLRDILQIVEIADYSIILCDVNGVGVALSEETQGAYVIEEIKKTYPEKIVIAYTAGSAVSKLVQRAQSKADGYLRKDASIEDWRDMLDQKIAQLADPIVTWKQLRLRLLSKDIELVDLLELEKVYLKNIKNGIAKAREKMQAELNATRTGGAWTGELAKFLASKAFDLALSASVDSIAG